VSKSGCRSGGSFGVSDPGPRQPPAADFGGVGWIANVYDHEELIVQPIVGLEIGRSGRQVCVSTVCEPEAVRSPGVRAGGVEV